MRESKVDGLFCKRGLCALMIGCMALGVCGCGTETLYPLYQAAETETFSSVDRERQLALEELEKKADRALAAGNPEEYAAEADAGSCLYAYRTLEEAEQLWYRDMVAAIRTMTDKVKLSEEGLDAGLDESRVDRIFQCVMSDHPEFFYVEGYTYTKFTRADKTVAIEFSGAYSLDGDTVAERRRRIEAEADRLIANVPEGADDYEKAKYVYESLILNTDYDLTAEDNQNIYSVFVNHVSVCQGYAKAAQYLLNKMGVECVLVQGEVLETGESHAWNLVRLDGEYYYMDATWGDISYQSSGEKLEEVLGQISYDYFAITTEQLLRTHRIDDTIGMPDCHAERDNFYVREGALFEEYDREQLAGLVERIRSEGRNDILIRCRSEACYEEMYEALLDGQEIFDYIEGDEITSFAYTTNERQRTMTFFMMTNKQ